MGIYLLVNQLFRLYDPEEAHLTKTAYIANTFKQTLIPRNQKIMVVVRALLMPRSNVLYISAQQTAQCCVTLCDMNCT